MLVKAFRLFVSSTFADFAQEREILQSKVFPALDAYCTAKGYQFYPLDLRWGINEEAQLDQRTSEICLSEVRAAKLYPPPNFLIMIGDRYGYVPLPYAIARDEFGAIAAWLQRQGRQDDACVLGSVYRHDGNHLVAPGLLETGPENGPLISAYTLRSRVDEIPELKPAEAWAQIQAHLRRALQEAADGLLAAGGIGAAAHEKYFLSLTEQEMVHGNGPEAIAFIRKIAGGSAAANPLYIEDEPRLDALKKRIERALPEGNIVTASTAFDKSGELGGTHLARFVAEIESKLKSAIDKHIARVEAIERAPNFALESERAAHSAFAAQRLKIFVGRKSNLAAIARYLADDGGQPLVLYGRSGLGKSALMGRAIEAAEAAGGPPVIARFIGASAASSNLRSLLMSLVEDLAAHSIVSKPAEFEQDANKFNAQIEALLSSIEKPANIFLDALDQLQKPYGLGWLPRKLPGALKLVLSVLNDPAYETDSGVYRSLEKRLPADAFLEIEPLTPAEGSGILCALEKQSQRGLQDNQRDYIIAKFETAQASPLYLRTAFEIARSWKSTATAGTGRFVLAEDAAGIIAQFIAELSTVHHHEPELVTRTLGYLAAAKDGLSEKEQTEVLSRDVGVMKAISAEKFGARTDKLPPSVWVRLNRDLAPFLVEKLVSDQPLLHFFHRQVAEVARGQHYEYAQTKLHAALAVYFESQATKEHGRAAYGKRSLSELPYQFHHAGETHRLDGILESPDWIQQKFTAFGSQVLVGDYEQFGRGHLQDSIGRTLRLTAGICERDKRQLIPQLHGRLMGQTPASDFCAAAVRAVNMPALITGMPSLTPPGAEVARLEGHTGSTRALAPLPDGRLASGSDDKTIRLWDVPSGAEVARLEGHTGSIRALVLLPDGRMASGSDDKTIRLWDVASGEEVARLDGHAGSILALALLPDGRLASGSHDNTIRLWDVASGAEVARLEGHTGSIRALALLPDGRLASGSHDNTIRLWDVVSGAEAARLEGHRNPIMALTLLPDGRLVSGSEDKTLRLWDVASGAEAARLDGHTGLIRALVLLPDGRLASGSHDNTIRLWDVPSGAEVARLEGHTGSIRALVLLPDGRLASGSHDNTIRLWDVASGAEIVRLEGHAGSILALALLPDGRLASGSHDNTIRLWDVASGAEIARLEGHSGSILALAPLPDGRLASGSHDNTIRLWDVASGAEIARLEGHSDWINALAPLPDGRLASGSDDKTIRLWNVASGAEVARLEGHTDSIRALAPLPDGRLASGSYDKTIRLWDVASGAEVARLEGRTGAIRALVLLPDGRLASGSHDNTIRLWDVASGAEAARLEGSTDWIMALAPLPDGRLASGSDENIIRLWDVATGQEITRLEVDAGVLCLLALPDGRLVAGDALARLHWLQVLDEAPAHSATLSHPQKVQSPPPPDATGMCEGWLSQWRLWNRKQHR